MQLETPWYLLDAITGFDDGDGDGDGDEGDGEGDGDGDEGTDGADGDDKATSTDGKEDTAGLKSALQKERRGRREAERELNKLKKTKADDDDKDATAVQKAEKARADAVTRSEKLAAKLRTTEVNNLIIKHAGTLNFQDVDDALSLVDRDEIDVDQDDDEPENVTVDEETVVGALKALLKKKPHLLKSADGAGTPSGGKFGGTGKTKDQLDEEALKEKYPALRR